jgi:hypothetical protein
MTVVDNRLDATVFMVNDVTDAGQRTSWAATLVGGSIVGTTFFENEESPVITKTKAIAVHKEIYISETARVNHPSIAETIKTATAMPGSKWKLIASADAFVARYVQANKSHRGPNVIAILSREDSKEPRSSYCNWNLVCLLACLIGSPLARF